MKLNWPRLILLILAAGLSGAKAGAQPCPIPWVVNGSAAVAADTVTLTAPILSGQTGSAWNPTPINLTSDFDFSFKVFLGTLDIGSDGVMFVLQSMGTAAIGDGGRNVGYAADGLPGILPSVAVEIDTYYNFEIPDPTYDHIAVNENAQRGHNGMAPVQASPSNINVEDGLEHDFRLVWNSTTRSLSVYFDGFLRLTYTKDIVSLIFGGNPVVYYGFTSSTGGGTNMHYFNQTSPCLAGATPTATATATSTATASSTATATATATGTPSTPTPTPVPLDVFTLSRNIYRPGIDIPGLFARVYIANPGNHGLSVYNTAGEQIRILRDGFSTTPWNEDVYWDGNNQFGEPAASGVYFFRLECELRIRLARVVLVR